MLSESYLDAGYDLADEMVYLFLNPFDTSVSSKLVTAMFNLKEIEGALHFGMDDENEVKAFANKSVVHILLSPVYNEDLCDSDEFEHYIDSVVNVCMVNRRLKYAFCLYKLVNGVTLLEHQYGKRSVDVLQKISSKLANSFS